MTTVTRGRGHLNTTLPSLPTLRHVLFRDIAECLFEVSQLTQVLEVDPDLVHPPGEGAAEHHAGRPVEAHPLELCPALLAVR